MPFNLKNYTISSGTHYEKNVIWLRFPRNIELQRDLKIALPAAKWSASQKAWYVPDVKVLRAQLGLEDKPINLSKISNKVSSSNLDALQRMTDEMKLLAYSPGTIKTYTGEFIQLLYLLKNKPVESITPDKLRSYILYCIKELQLSENQIHSRLNALKFYFEKVLRREKFFMEIPRPQKPTTLPKVLSQTEIEKMFWQTLNIKHLIMLKSCYGMGLRVSEIVNLKIADIDSKRMLVHIQGGKGKKDRYVPLPQSLLPELREYYKLYKPSNYLFEGQYGGHYSVRSVQSVFKQAMNKAKIRKKIGIHGLRHSYATHLLEYGTDMVFIQKLMGHNNIKTTEIYAKVSNTHLSKVKSPLDRIVPK